MKTGCLLVSAAAMALANGCGGPRDYYVEQLQVDRALNLHPVGIRSVTEPAVGSYYFIFHAGTGLTSIEHFERKAAGRERVLDLETFRSERVDRTVKADEILRGAFGTLYAEKTCFYSDALERGYSGVSVGSNSNELGHEIPHELSALPDVLPPLTSLSLVRIFRIDPEYVVGSANYEAAGELSSLHIDKNKGGDWVSGESRLHVNQEDLDLKKYGIPVRIDVEGYLRLHRLTMPPVALPQVISLLNQHYGYDEFIRQDRLDDGSVISSRLLRPSITEEERTLNPVCEARFLQQKAKGLGTVN